MKQLFFLVLFILAQQFSLLGNTLPIKELRRMFDRSTRSEQECERMIKALDTYNEKNNPLYYGYKAGAVMMMAKHVINPFTKLSYFKKGKNMLESAIKTDKNNLELRFLRYTIQTNVPGFLNYGQNQRQDREFIISSLPALQDQDLKQIINHYLKSRAKS